MNIYIDESGSINTKNIYPFIIGIVIPTDVVKLKKVYKRFVSKYYKDLKNLDKANKMFRKDGFFLELKGACFDKNMKLNFLDYFCRNNLFKVRYIVLNNTKIEEKFVENKARTFNFLMKLFIENCFHLKYFSDKEVSLQIDERNIKTNSKYSLEDYLNQELRLNLDLIEKAKVVYFDSAKNTIIQIADVFSNIKFSDYATNGAYKDILKEYYKKGYILKDFYFPRKWCETVLFFLYGKYYI